MAFSDQAPRFFVRGPSALARLTVFAVLSLALMLIDSKYQRLEPFRQAISTALYPLQQAALWPGHALRSLGEFFESREGLRQENAVLKAQALSAGVAAQSAAAVLRENASLRATLQLAERIQMKSTAARVMSTGRDPFSQKLFLDRGEQAGLAAGRAVLDAQGVLGQITRVYPLIAEVTLITERDHAVPVRLERTGTRSVLFGRGLESSPELRYVPNTVDVQVGDRLLTSGLDGIYPADVAVARVTKIHHDPSARFAQIDCEPLAGIRVAEHVLVVDASPTVAPLPSAELPAAAPAARRRR